MTNEQIASLRTSGQIAAQEVAFIEGDLVVAKNVVTEEKRIIGTTKELGLVVESKNKRTLLKD